MGGTDLAAKTLKDEKSAAIFPGKEHKLHEFLRCRRGGREEQKNPEKSDFLGCAKRS
jgi:hypothetical protein